MTTDERHFFPENERLRLNKDIVRLFGEGKTFISYPLRIAYLRLTGNNTSDSPISILVSVPKKRIKLAVNRNRIKRLIRESFRLNKNETSNLYTKCGNHLHVAYIYICKEMKNYHDIEKAVRKAFKTINNSLTPA